MQNSKAVVAELVQIFGLHPGLELKETQTVDRPAQLRLVELNEGLDKLAKADRDSILAQLAAGYLPCLAQLTAVHFQEPYDPLKTSAVIPWMSHIFLRPGPEPMAVRFIRELPDRAMELICITASWLGDRRALDEGRFKSIMSSLLSSVELLRELLFHLVATVPKGEDRSIDFSGAKNPLDVAFTLRRVQVVDPRRVAHLADLFEGVAQGPPGTWKFGNKMGNPQVFSSCEAKRMLSTAGNACTALPQGRQMQVCGGCHSVRYCSQAHQKADWKRHKLYCFKPSW